MRYDGVNSGAWQACGATLALVGDEPTFADYTFNELQTLFRSGPALTGRTPLQQANRSLNYCVVV